jgi:tricarballylate dehydrogenase
LTWDVVVIGGGNAGLVAAIAARRRGRRVLLLERAGAAMRGGNTRHTRNARCASAEYPADELWADLRGVGPRGRWPG